MYTWTTSVTMEFAGADAAAPGTPRGGDLGGADHLVQVAGGGTPPPVPAQPAVSAVATAPVDTGSAGSELTAQAALPLAFPVLQLPGVAGGAPSAGPAAAPAPNAGATGIGGKAGGAPPPSAADIAALSANMTMIMSQLAQLQAAQTALAAQALPSSAGAAGTPAASALALPPVASSALAVSQPLSLGSPAPGGAAVTMLSNGRASPLDMPATPVMASPSLITLLAHSIAYYLQ